MRIQMIAPEFPPAVGGMEVHALKSAELLSAIGHDVEVLTARGSSPPQAKSAYPIRRVLTRSFRRNLRSIRTAVRAFAPDALLVMNAGFTPVVDQLYAGALPVLVRTAGNDAYAAWHGPRLPFRFLFWRLPASRPGSLGAILRRIDQERRVRSIVASLSRCRVVLCNSSYSLFRLRGLGVPADRLRVLAGGVDVRQFSPRVPPHRSGGSVARRPPILGLAGSLKPIKGIDVALRMLPSLSGEARDARLRIAGTGPDEVRLRALARELGVEDRVEFLGAVPLEKMPDFYRDLDLYLQPSIEISHEASGAVQAESMGRSLCEAQACGIPVIASRCGGIPDVVHDGVSGRLVVPGDAGALAETVAACLSKPDHLARMGEAGRRLAVERFSWEVVVGEMARSIEQVAGRAAPPCPASCSN